MEDFVVMNYVVVVVVVVEKPKIVEESGNHADQSYQSQVCCLTHPCFWSKGRGGKTQTKIDPIGVVVVVVVLTAKASIIGHVRNQLST